MRHVTETPPPYPFDVRALWDMSNGAAAFGGEAMRAWFAGASKLSTETTAFWTDRMSKDVTAMAALARCTTPADAFDAQIDYAREAVADFYAEGQRMMRIVNEAAKQGMPATPDVKGH